MSIDLLETTSERDRMRLHLDKAEDSDHKISLLEQQLTEEVRLASTEARALAHARTHIRGVPS